MFRNSLKEFKNVRSLSIMAMLMAITIVLGYFSIQIGNYIKIGFAAIPHELASIFFGPVAGAIYGAASDIIKYVIRPTGPFFPGFTISGIASGFIYGLILYKRPYKFHRVLIANILVALIVNLGMNTYWLSILYGKGFMLILPGRIVKEVIMCGVNTVLTMVVLNATRTLQIGQSQE